MQTPHLKAGAILLSAALLVPGIGATPPSDFTYTISGNRVTITGYIGPGGDIDIPQTIDDVPVTTIAANAFRGANHLSSVTLPDSVTTIGSWAFGWCLNVTNFSIGSGLNSMPIDALQTSRSLQNISVHPDNTRYSSIDGVLFNKSATTLIKYPSGKQGPYTIPAGVVIIDHSALQFSHGLTSVTIPDTVLTISEQSFMSCYAMTDIHIGNSVRTIGRRAFDHCTNLTSVIIPNSVTGIVDHAFYACRALATVQFGHGLRSIGWNAFLNCTSLREAILGNSVTHIGQSAFSGCASLGNVVIPATTTRIDQHAFDFTGLTNISVAAENPSFSSLDGVLFNKDRIILLRYPQLKVGTYIIPEGVTGIGLGAFQSSSHLPKVFIPASVTGIGENAFRFCPSLKEVYFFAANREASESRLLRRKPSRHF